MTTSPVRQHMPWVDVLRIIGCLAVLFIHVEYRHGAGGYILLPIIDFYGIAFFMLFFLVSGMLAFACPRPFSPFLRSKFRRIVVPMLVWSIIYLAMRAATGHLALNDLPARLALLPFKPQVPQFWYLYVLLGVYLLTPIAAHWLHHSTQRQVIFYLALWGVTLCIPLAAHYCPDITSSIEVVGPLFYLQGFAGVMLLGHYMHRYVHFSHLPWWHWLITLTLGTVPIWYRLLPLPYSLLNTYLSPNMIALSCAIFVLVRQVAWPQQMHGILNFLGQSSYGVYLMHMVVILGIVNPIIEPLRLNYWIGIPLALGLTLAISLSLVWLLSHLRWAWVLGCDLKKK